MTPPKPARDAPPSRPDPHAIVAGYDRRNPGTDLLLDAVRDLTADERALGTRAAGATGAALGGTEAARLSLVVRLLDLTTLSEHDTGETVRRLCRNALEPLRGERADLPDPGRPEGVQVAAVCVFDRLVPDARRALEGSEVRVAAVTAGFPHPAGDLGERRKAVRSTVASGADEIDLVITRDLALAGDWPALYDEVKALREASGGSLLKTILAAGDLRDLDTVARAGLVCCMAGADFIKTSTGREHVNATLPIGMAMAAAIRRYRELSGADVGLKPAGGIRSAEQVLDWLRLVERELGPRFVHPSLFRIGASSLLDGIRMRLRALGHTTSG